jgi:hypothetical protein
VVKGVSGGGNATRADKGGRVVTRCAWKVLLLEPGEFQLPHLSRGRIEAAETGNQLPAPLRFAHGRGA